MKAKLLSSASLFTGTRPFEEEGGTRREEGLRRDESRHGRPNVVGGVSL